MTNRLRASSRTLRASFRLTLAAPALCAASLSVLACGSSASSGAASGSEGSTFDSDSGDLASNDAGGGGAQASSGSRDAATINLGQGAGDGSVSEAASCSQINIGILGLPGSDSSSNFQAWLVSSGTSVTSIQTTATDPLTAAELAPFDVVILNQLQRDYTSAEAAIFATWVENGGGVAAMSGFANDTTVDFHANSLLAPLAIAYADPFFDNGPVTQFATSPITTGLTSVTFIGGYAVNDLGGTTSTRTSLASLDGSSVGYAVTMGAGHAFAWGDEWIQYDSQWSTIPEIKQLWVQVFAWIAPMTKCALNPPK